MKGGFKGSKDKNIVIDGILIQSGYIYKDEYSGWLFFINLNNEYYVIQNTKGLGKKVGCSVIGEVVGDDYIKVLRVYDD